MRTYTEIETQVILPDGRSFVGDIGRVNYTFLGRIDGPAFALHIDLAFAGYGQGTGYYSLDTLVNPPEKRKEEEIPIEEWHLRTGLKGGMDMIINIVDVFGVNSWERLKGERIMVLRAKKHGNSPILGFVNLDTPTKYFVFGDLKWEG